MPSIVFYNASNGAKKELDISEVNSLDDVVTNAKEVMKQDVDLVEQQGNKIMEMGL